MFLTALALTASGLSAAVQPDRWVHVGGSPGLYEEHLDKESVTRSGDKVTLWTRRDFGRDAIEKARAIVEKARSAIERRDAALVKEQIEGLTRTHRMFKGVVAKT